MLFIIVLFIFIWEGIIMKSKVHHIWAINTRYLYFFCHKNYMSKERMSKYTRTNTNTRECCGKNIWTCAWVAENIMFCWQFIPFTFHRELQLLIQYFRNSCPHLCRSDHLKLLSNLLFKSMKRLSCTAVHRKSNSGF